MFQTARRKLLVTGLTALLGACSTTPNFEIKNNIRGLEKGKITQDDAPFDYQTITVARIAYEIERVTRRLPDEEDFILREDMESTLWRNFNKRQGRIESEEIGVLKRSYVSKRDESGNVVKENGKEVMVPAREVDFAITGPYALSAEISRPDLTDLGIDSITKQLEKYRIETREINGRPYAISVKTDKFTGKVTQVLFIRTGEEDVELGTRREDGQITLRSPEDIYELVFVKQKDYDARTNYTNTGTSERALTPEAIEIR